jgi:hypothetical protein
MLFQICHGILNLTKNWHISDGGSLENVYTEHHSRKGEPSSAYYSRIRRALFTILSDSINESVVWPTAVAMRSKTLVYSSSNPGIASRIPMRALSFVSCVRVVLCR